MTDWLDRVRAGYDADPEAEWRRLEGRVQNRIEYLVTMHAIDRHLPPPEAHPRVLDAGGGPGRYTIALARRGYLMTLLDLSAGNVALARRRIDEAGSDVSSNVERTVEGSFTDLSMFPDERFDAVLCLGGALSHILDADDRLRALVELRRVAKPGAPVLISAGNALSGLRTVVQWPYTWQSVFDAWERGGTSSLECGAPYYEFMPEEFVAILDTSGFEVARLYGCQGIAAHLPPDNLESLMADPVRWPLWRERLLATCDHPNIVGLSCHLIAAVRVRSSEFGVDPEPV